MDETAPEKDAEQKRSAVESGGDSSSAPDPAASASKRKQQLLPKKVSSEIILWQYKNSLNSISGVHVHTRSL